MATSFLNTAIEMSQVPGLIILFMAASRMYLLNKRLENRTLMNGFKKYLNIYWQMMEILKRSERHIKYTAPVAMIVVLVVECLQFIFIASLPGIMAGSIRTRVDDIKLTLARHLYSSSDQVDKTDIENFLRIIELRPFMTRVWRVVPVDAALPAGLLSLCTTYLIVLIQFYHLFEQ
ncbi:hypothetical protein EVAR_71118_1 [Eumeta japonica]|uniref:Uncharacterized protein n=1 Tax=Eumeta variegata TaxID=151549 RepID=A0A4C1ZPG8_EUMVA|nr:hypothetical protein EVAR_71118_1 [Eumeta japonica]